MILLDYELKSCLVCGVTIGRDGSLHFMMEHLRDTHREHWAMASLADRLSIRFHGTVYVFRLSTETMINSYEEGS